jgi:hypothetical protein
MSTAPKQLEEFYYVKAHGSTNKKTFEIPLDF